jgi:hypothetical protein
MINYLIVADVKMLVFWGTVDFKGGQKAVRSSSLSFLKKSYTQRFVT